MKQDNDEGFALICDQQGRITEVLQRDTIVGARLESGVLFTTAIDPASRPKAGEFLAEIERNGSAFEWELNVRSGQEVATMVFSGHDSPAGVLIVAARRAAGMPELLERVAAGAPDSVVASIASQLARSQPHSCDPSSPARPRDIDLYDELSRLNNELVTMQRELARKNAELHRIDKLKNQFLGIVAHDLRSPLTVIVAYSDFLLFEDQPRLNERQLRFVRSIRSSSQFMVDLVNDLLDVSVIESGSLELETEACDLLEIISESVEMHRVLGERKQLAIELSMPASLPELLLDRRRIEQVLNNVIGNAIKFSPTGATIRIRVTRERDEAVIAVSDRGIGIPASDLTKIFEPFRRSRARGTAGEKSTGLGLTIARRIVEAHSGRIRLESTEGVGTTFFISLPLQKSP